MDGTEKRVFRRKHALLSTLLEPSPSYLLLLQKQGILTDAMASQIQVSPEKDKMTLLLTLLESGHSNTLTKIIYMLEQTGYDWIADEIHADLQWERGKIQIEDYVIQEAVYFANTLLSDRGYIDLSRKDDLSVIIASRHQVAKEAWKRQMTRKSQKVKGELHSVQQDVMKMFKDIDKVLIAKGKWRVRRDKDTTEESAKKEEKMKKKKEEEIEKEYSMSVKLLQDRLDNLQQVLDNVIDEYDKLVEERRRCFDIVGAQPEEGTLEVVLNNMLSKITRELGQTSTEAEAKKSLIKSLDKEVKALKGDLSSQLSKKSDQILTLQRSLDSTERRWKDALENLADMTRKRDIFRAQVDYWKERTEILERTRRLGYYHFSRMHQPIPMKQDLPGTKTRTALYYDPALLESEGNIVHIKGDSNIKPPVSDPKTTTKQAHRLPSKPRRAIESSSYEPSFKDASINPRRTQSIFHSKCLPGENTSSANTHKNKSLHTSNSSPNLLQSDKSTAVKTRGANKKPAQDEPKHESKDGGPYLNKVQNGQRKKENIYSGKPTPEILTSGLNYSPYTRGNLSLLTTTKPLTSYQHQGEQNSDNSMNTYYSTEQVPQILASGLYRPVLMSQTAPNTNTQVVNKAILRNTFFTYSENEEECTIHASLGPQPEPNSREFDQTPKEKFDESVRRVGGEGKHIRVETAIKESSSKTSSHQSQPGKSASSSSGGPFSAKDGNRPDAKKNSEKEVKERNGADPKPPDGHCRCCPQCCREAPTSHSYQGPVG